MSEYIEREAFIARQRELYCQNCNRRRGMKDGKLTKRFVYQIGDAPCRACDVDDMINAVDDFPAADVKPVVCCRDCVHWTRIKKDCIMASCELDALVRYEDFFCACGRKREADNVR